MTDVRRHIPALVLIAFAAALYPLQNWIDATSGRTRIEEETLYLSNGTTIGKIAFGYEALLADIYWMRTVQYFGRKVLEDPTILNQRSNRLALIYPLTDVITDLDPRHTPAYRFGGFFLHDYVDPVKAFTILNKSLQKNPGAWQVYQDLAFLYWTDNRCEEAANTYTLGSKVPGAPHWMATLAGTVLVDCGNVDTARQMYLHMAQESTDARIIADVDRKLKELRALDEVTLLREAVAEYVRRNGAPPPLLGQVRPLIPTGEDVPTITYNAEGAPVDPYGVPYWYDPKSGFLYPNLGSMQLPLGVRRDTRGW